MAFSAVCRISSLVGADRWSWRQAAQRLIHGIEGSACHLGIVTHISSTFGPKSWSGQHYGVWSRTRCGRWCSGMGAG